MSSKWHVDVLGSLVFCLKVSYLHELPGYDLLCVGVTSSGAEVQLDSSCGGHTSTVSVVSRRNKA